MDIFLNEFREAHGIPMVKNRLTYAQKAGDRPPSYSTRFDGKSEAEEPAYRELFRIMHQERYTWVGLPHGVDGKLLETIAYSRGRVCIFYDKTAGKFFVLPFTLAESGIKGQPIDESRRYKNIKPLPWGGSSFLTDEQGNDVKGGQASQYDVLLGAKIRSNVWEIPFVKNKEEARKMMEESAVIIFDRTPGFSYEVIPSMRLMDPFISRLKELRVFLASAELNSTGCSTWVTTDGTGAEVMQEQLDAMQVYKMHGGTDMVMKSPSGIEPKNVQKNHPADLDSFWSDYYNHLNLAMTLLGVSSSGMSNGSQYTNDAQIALNNSPAMAMYMNGWNERVKSAAIINSIWGCKCYPMPTMLMGAGAVASPILSNQQGGYTSQDSGNGGETNDSGNK